MDSFSPEKVGHQQFLADLASAAILISYLNKKKTGAAGHQSLLNTVHSSPNQSPDININTTQLIQLLAQQINNTMTNHRTNNLQVQAHTTKSPKVSTKKNTKKPQRKLKSLLVKGLIKKGIKKKIKAKKKKKIANVMSSIAAPIAQLFKHPKEYWFDVKFDVDLYDIMKKKFLYYLALKYMPVALVVALKLVPLALAMIPLLWKIYWVKKKPKYIRVPVPIPVPKPYPVYKYLKPHHKHHSSYHDDHKYSSSDTNKLYEGATLPPPSHQFHPEYIPPPPPIILKTPYGPHPIDLQNEANRIYKDDQLFRPQTVTNAYEFGFDLGSKMGSTSTLLTNHDREVLKILIQSRKDKLKKLLQKWNLLPDKRMSSTSIQRLGHFVTESNHKENINKLANEGLETNQILR